MNSRTYRILLFVYVLAILVVSSIPGHRIPELKIWSFDKLLHIIEYFILAFLAVNIINRISTKTIVLLILVGTIYGGFNELWQGWFATRDADIYDAIANGIGMILGSVISVKYLLFTHD